MNWHQLSNDDYEQLLGHPSNNAAEEAYQKLVDLTEREEQIELPENIANWYKAYILLKERPIPSFSEYVHQHPDESRNTLRKIWNYTGLPYLGLRDLPIELIRIIFSDLDWDSLRHACSSSFTYRKECNSSEFWRALIFLRTGQILPDFDVKELKNYYRDVISPGTVWVVNLPLTPSGQFNVSNRRIPLNDVIQVRHYYNGMINCLNQRGEVFQIEGENIERLEVPPVHQLVKQSYSPLLLGKENSIYRIDQSGKVEQLRTEMLVEGAAGYSEIDSIVFFSMNSVLHMGNWEVNDVVQNQLWNQYKPISFGNTAFPTIKLENGSWIIINSIAAAPMDIASSNIVQTSHWLDLDEEGKLLKVDDKSLVAERVAYISRGGQSDTQGEAEITAYITVQGQLYLLYDNQSVPIFNRYCSDVDIEIYSDRVELVAILKQKEFSGGLIDVNW